MSKVSKGAPTIEEMAKAVVADARSYDASRGAAEAILRGELQTWGRVQAVKNAFYTLRRMVKNADINPSPKPAASAPVQAAPTAGKRSADYVIARGYLEGLDNVGLRIAVGQLQALQAVHPRA